MNKPMSPESMDELVRAFADATVQQNLEIARGSSKGSDRAAKRRANAWQRLTNCYGDKGRDALKVLFSDPDTSVRAMTASYLLRHCTAEALAILRNVAENEQGLAGLAAKCSIRNWMEGKWHLDP